MHKYPCRQNTFLHQKSCFPYRKQLSTLSIETKLTVQSVTMSIVLQQKETKGYHKHFALFVAVS